MDVKSDRQADVREIDALKTDILTHLRRQVGVSQENATPRDWLLASSLAVRSLLVERWHASNEQLRRAKQVGYLSMEFLLSRQLQNALLALGLSDRFGAALKELGVTLSDLVDLSLSPRWEMAVLAVWPPAFSIPWRASACRHTDTVSITNMGCSGRTSPAAGKSNSRRNGWSA